MTRVENDVRVNVDIHDSSLQNVSRRHGVRLRRSSRESTLSGMETKFSNERKRNHADEARRFLA